MYRELLCLKSEVEGLIFGYLSIPKISYLYSFC